MKRYIEVRPAGERDPARVCFCCGEYAAYTLRLGHVYDEKRPPHAATNDTRMCGRCLRELAVKTTLTLERAEGVPVCDECGGSGVVRGYVVDSRGQSGDPPVFLRLASCIPCETCRKAGRLGLV